jgi:transcription elongation factor Elf1
METERPDKNEPKKLKSAHVCPQCGFSIALENLGLRGGATGVVSCLKCDWSGPVEIQIINRESAD